MNWFLTTAYYEYVIKVDMTLEELKVLNGGSRDMTPRHMCCAWPFECSVYSMWSLNMRYCPSQLWLGGSCLKETVLSQFRHLVWGGSSDRKRGTGSFISDGEKEHPVWSWGLILCIYTSRNPNVWEAPSSASSSHPVILYTDVCSGFLMLHNTFFTT